MPKIKKKYKIKDSNIIGHSDISPLRKQDPGEKFPWEDLNKNQIGVWYKILNLKPKKINNKDIENLFFKNLFKIGYRYFSLNRRRKSDILLVKAFQRRFLPNKVTGRIDKKTYMISHFLAYYHKN